MDVSALPAQTAESPCKELAHLGGAPYITIRDDGGGMSLEQMENMAKFGDAGE